MSAELLNQNEVLAIMKRVVEMGLQEFDVTNFRVKQFAEADFTNGDKLVMLNYISSKRVGWQGYHYDGTNETRTDEWLEQQRWHIHIMCKRHPQTDTQQTLTAEDIASYLSCWFDGVGCDELRKYGMANLPIDRSAFYIYNDDSSLYQRRVVLNLDLQIPKLHTAKDKFFKFLGYEIHKV